MILTHALVLLAHLDDLVQFERSAQGIERRTPYLAIGIGSRDHDQTLGLFGGSAGTLIGDVGGSGGALEQQILLGVIAGAELPQVPGEPQPGYATVGCDRDDLSEDPHPAAVVPALEGGVDLAPQLGNGFRHLARCGPDLGFELDRRVGEIVAFE